jgi:C2 domain
MSDSDSDATEDSLCTLEVEIVKARGLAVKDVRTSDPYVVVRWVETEAICDEYKTKVCKSTLSPLWNEKFSVTVPSFDSVLIFRMHDYDSHGSHDAMGTVRLKMKHILQLQNGRTRGWLPLGVDHLSPKSKVSGELYLDVRVMNAAPLLRRAGIVPAGDVGLARLGSVSSSFSRLPSPSSTDSSKKKSKDGESLPNGMKYAKAYSFDRLKGKLQPKTTTTKDDNVPRVPDTDDVDPTTAEAIRAAVDEANRESDERDQASDKLLRRRLDDDDDDDDEEKREKNLLAVMLRFVASIFSPIAMATRAIYDRQLASTIDSVYERYGDAMWFQYARLLVGFTAATLVFALLGPIKCLVVVVAALLHYSSRMTSAARDRLSTASVALQAERQAALEVPTHRHDRGRQPVGWLNAVLMKLWRNSAQKLVDDQIETIQQQIDEQLPLLGIGMRLTINSINIGKEPPRLEYMSTEESASHVIVINTKLSWRSKLRVSIAVRPGLLIVVPVLVKELTLRAAAQLTVTFNNARNPLDTDVALCLLKPTVPDVHIMPVGTIDTKWLPGISAMIRNLISSSLNDMLLWPARMRVNLDSLALIDDMPDHQLLAANDEQVPPITDIAIIWANHDNDRASLTSDADGNPLAAPWHMLKRTVGNLPANANRDSGSDQRIFLAYRRESGAPPITDIAVYAPRTDEPEQQLSRGGDDEQRRLDVVLRTLSGHSADLNYGPNKGTRLYLAIGRHSRSPPITSLHMAFEDIGEQLPPDVHRVARLYKNRDAGNLNRRCRKSSRHIYLGYAGGSNPSFWY